MPPLPLVPKSMFKNHKISYGNVIGLKMEKERSYSLPSFSSFSSSSNCSRTNFGRVFMLGSYSSISTSDEFWTVKQSLWNYFQQYTTSINSLVLEIIQDSVVLSYEISEAKFRFSIQTLI